tara:strand:- start:169 stop:402 length:234 start_codon:yes stop_codon:yes gene_type:complete
MLVGYLMSFEIIISRAIPSYEIAENEAYLTFLEKTPSAMRHIVVIPKEKPESVLTWKIRLCQVSISLRYCMASALTP